jgi:hypothetical protein
VEPALVEALAQLGDPVLVPRELRPNFAKTEAKPVEECAEVCRSSRGVG